MRAAKGDEIAGRNIRARRCSPSFRVSESQVPLLGRLLTLQQLRLLLALMLARRGRAPAAEYAVSVSGEAQIQLVRRRLHPRGHVNSGCRVRKTRRDAVAKRTEGRALRRRSIRRPYRPRYLLPPTLMLIVCALARLISPHYRPVNLL